jgi:hypothetical protein
MDMEEVKIYTTPFLPPLQAGQGLHGEKGHQVYRVQCDERLEGTSRDGQNSGFRSVPVIGA